LNRKGIRLVRRGQTLLGGPYTSWGRKLFQALISSNPCFLSSVENCDNNPYFHETTELSWCQNRPNAATFRMKSLEFKTVHALFISYKNIVFPTEAEFSYYYADFRLKIFLWLFLDYCVWHFCFRMYYFSVWMVLE